MVLFLLKKGIIYDYWFHSQMATQNFLNGDLGLGGVQHTYLSSPSASLTQETQNLPNNGGCLPRTGSILWPVGHCQLPTEYMGPNNEVVLLTVMSEQVPLFCIQSHISSSMCSNHVYLLRSCQVLQMR